MLAKMNEGTINEHVPQLLQLQTHEEHMSISDADDACVLLDNDDIQCGHIFFSESSRVLKYYCIFCKSTYDNINYYCEHLSTHINAGVHADAESTTEVVEEVVNQSQEQYYETEESLATSVDNCYYYGESSVPSLSGDGSENLSVTTTPLELGDSQFEDMVESIIGTEVVNDEIQQEHVTEIIPTELPMDTFKNDELNYVDNEQTYPDEEILQQQYDESKEEELKKETSPQYRKKNSTAAEETSFNTDVSTEDSEAAMDFENMIVATNIRGNLNEAGKPEKRKKGKKVTTVKVIAVKNRIAELYERIKSEEEKRSQMSAIDVMQASVENPIRHNYTEEYLPTDDINEKSYEGPTTVPPPASTTTKTMTQQMRGETLITLLPDGVQADEGINVSSYIAKPIQPNNNNRSPKVEGKSREKVCPACGMHFRSSFSLTIHKRTHYLESNSEVKLAHKCSDCNRLFNKISEMKVHLERDHYPDGFICKICQKRLTSLTLLEKHMRLVHLNRPFSCKICQKSFETRTLYEAHVDSHVEGRNYKCRICGRKYGTEQSLKHHMRRHKEQVPKCCVVCGKMTLRITQHMKIHTPRPKRVLSCKVCGKLFNFSSGLSHHFKIMHKLPRPQSKIKVETATSTHLNSSSVISNARRRRRVRSNANDDRVEQEILLDHEQQELHLMEQQHHEDHPQQQQHSRHHHHHQQQQQQQDVLQHESQEQILLDAEVPHELQQDVHHQYTTYNVTDSQLQQQDVNEKEEEAKRVIVELIQNATYTSFLPDNHMNEFEVGPPIAREETISAVNSIVNDC